MGGSHKKIQEPSHKLHYSFATSLESLHGRNTIPQMFHQLNLSSFYSYFEFSRFLCIFYNFCILLSHRIFPFRFNLSQLEDWVRINQLESGNILEGLECITQATRLLQVNKSTLEDVEAICEVCSSLNTLQVRRSY